MVESDHTEAPAQPGDAALWAAAVRGDPAAFGALFARHANAVYGHCFRRMASWDSAEDATSLVFLEAWRGRDKVVLVEGSVLPWLLGVAANVCRNAKRAERRYETKLYRLPRPDPEPDPSDDIAERLDHEARGRKLLLALRHLNRAQREAIELVDLSGLSYTEAAVALGVPVGTVRSRLARGRKYLALLARVSSREPATAAPAAAVLGAGE
jgi:RNA polymerase sigma-70 factor (ECF subfamily)